MDYYIDVAFDSLNKYNEELCGDTVQIERMEDCTIIALADGLGSGVKASILSSLTSKIASTMLKKGEDIYEVVDTIMNTLPICSVRKIAYSTFTIIKVFNNGEIYVAEYDNPPFYLLRKGKLHHVEKEEVVINNNIIKESNFTLEPGDIFTVISDGVINAGVGNILNLGWSWDAVGNYLQRNFRPNITSKVISKNLVEVCSDLYGGKPGDDTTVLSIRLTKPQYVELFTGPPSNSENDAFVIKQFIKGKGKKVICGGTAANIAARELKLKLIHTTKFIEKDVPPIAYMDGIDLVTEGVITLTAALNKMNNYLGNYYMVGKEQKLKGEDGASKLARMLIEECTHLTLWIGRAVNPAHQFSDFPMEYSQKLIIIYEISKVMKKIGKWVKINYV